MEKSGEIVIIGSPATRFERIEGVIMAVILHLTTLHPRTDTRVFIKEAQTLASSYPHFKTYLMVADGKGNVDAELGRVSIHDLGNFGRGRFRRMLVSICRASLAIDRIKPNIVHFHDPELIPLGILLKIFGYKVIYDVHEDAPRSALSRPGLPLVIRMLISWFINCAEWCGAKIFDGIISATPKIAGRFPGNKTAVIQNFPISDEMACPSFSPHAERPQSFAYVGYITMNRGAVEMVRAFELLADTPKVKFELAGSFSPETLFSTLQALPGWAFVNYHGPISREQMANLFGQVRAGLVLFHPLPNHIDAQPNKMFEYMSAGLPVVASDFPLWRRIIQGADCGLLVDPFNPKAIAEALRWILNHPDEAEAMGQRGRKAVEQTYNWDAEASKLIGLYNSKLVVS